MDYLRPMFIELALETKDPDGFPALSEEDSPRIRTYISSLLENGQFSSVVGLLREMHFSPPTVQDKIVLMQGLRSSLDDDNYTDMIALFGAKIGHTLVEIVMDGTFFGFTKEETLQDITVHEDPQRRLYKEILVSLFRFSFCMLRIVYDIDRSIDPGVSADTLRSYVGEILPKFAPMWNALWKLTPTLRSATQAGPADIYYQYVADLGLVYIYLHKSIRFSGKECGYPNAYTLLLFAIDAYAFTWIHSIRRGAFHVAHMMMDPNILPTELRREALASVIKDGNTAQLFINAYCCDLSLKINRRLPEEMRLINDNLVELVQVWADMLCHGPELLIKLAAMPQNLERIVSLTVAACHRQRCAGGAHMDTVLQVCMRILKLLRQSQPGDSNIVLSPQTVYLYLILCFPTLTYWTRMGWTKEAEELMDSMMLYGTAHHSCDMSTLPRKAQEDIRRLTYVCRCNWKKAAQDLEAVPNAPKTKTWAAFMAWGHRLIDAPTTERKGWRPGRAAGARCIAARHARNITGDYLGIENSVANGPSRTTSRCLTVCTSALGPMFTRLSLNWKAEDPRSLPPLSEEDFPRITEYVSQLLEKQQYSDVVELLREMHFSSKTIEDRVIMIRATEAAIYELECREDYAAIVALFGAKIGHVFVDIMVDNAFCGSTKEERRVYRDVIHEVSCACVCLLRNVYYDGVADPGVPAGTLSSYIADLLPELDRLWNALVEIAPILRLAKDSSADMFYQYGTDLGYLYVQLHQEHFGREYGFPTGYKLLLFALETYGFAPYNQRRRLAIDITYIMIDPGILSMKLCRRAFATVISDQKSAQSFIAAYCHDMRQDRSRPTKWKVMHDNLFELVHVWSIMLLQGPEIFARSTSAPFNLEHIVTATTLACERQLCSGEGKVEAILLQSTRLLGSAQFCFQLRL
ncbi:hypothetical protein NM688_g3004 [Phlebia brevispora]|uniref:Uncharacterized protein n=1 Tax=Phlebia brevispora TaxID=194682 RepID=A0ACC1T7N0_9APHY|nr:hypothetical protein NM688_g3004 [Phlebia brevispora]